MDKKSEIKDGDIDSRAIGVKRRNIYIGEALRTLRLFLT